MRKTLFIFLPLLSIFFFYGCDVIGEDDRFKIAEQVEVKKNVLLVEFTDQNCINCPDAAKEIENLKERYQDTLVAVSMHAYPLPLSLVTADGNVYEKYFETDKIGHPIVIIDGKHKDSNIAGWGAKIVEQLGEESPVDIELISSYNSDSRMLIITSTITAKIAVAYQYQLWLTEDNIVDYQKISANESINNYVHNHIFRAVVNGTWGENIMLEEEEKKILTHSFVLNQDWMPENMHIVGFVFDDNSKNVAQTVEIKLLK